MTRWPCPTAGLVDTHEADTRDTRGGQCLEAQPKRTRGGHKAHKAVTRRTYMAYKVWRQTQGGRTADKLRGRGQSISRPAFFLLRENPTVNCMGKNEQLKQPDQLGYWMLTTNYPVESHIHSTLKPADLMLCLSGSLAQWHSRRQKEDRNTSHGGKNVSVVSLSLCNLY